MSKAPAHDKHIRFDGGVHPADGKELTAHQPTQSAPLLERYTVLLSQNIGAPPELNIKKGDRVKKGDVLAVAKGFVSAVLHAPTSGLVKDIGTCPSPVGVRMPAVEIEADGEDAWGPPMEPMPAWRDIDPARLKQRVADAGVVGMGGAAFPTHVKLSPPPGKTIDTLLLNGAECEPYLTADHRLMLEQAADIAEGAAMVAHILGVKNTSIGIEANKPDALDAMRRAAAPYGIEVKSLRVRYPQGAEKQLIYALTGRSVPLGGLPMDVGCIVQNVATTAAMAVAIREGRPLIDRITTVTGDPVVRPGNWRFKIGTSIFHALQLAGGVKYQPAKMILGGPMMGLTQASLDVTLMKNSSGLLLLSPEQIAQYTSEPCIRCGRCVETCPMKILPGTISMATESEHFDLAEKLDVMACVECGSCTYACPAHRPLTQHCRRGKAEVAARKKARK